MLFKLAMRNVRRSVRDYAIYFVTLFFGVAIFYAFNSIGEQRLLFELESSTTAMMFDSTQIFIVLFSVVVAVVLGFLVLYANRMLIGRRKHEFGIYLTLGMSPSAISRVVLYETVLVGVVSLAVGLALGFLLSQFLSFFTAAMFQITMNEYRFVFSPESFVMTLVCFAVIYVVVTLFNVVMVNRFKLITLLSASAKNEKVTMRNPWVCLVAFIASVGVIAASYAVLAHNRFVNIDGEFWLATALMVVGTLLFFWSLAGFAIALITRVRGAYLRGLVPFTVRQIASKVNTAFCSLWMVCILLFFAITTFSVGMGLITVFAGEIDAANPYDATLRSYPQLGYSLTDDPNVPTDPDDPAAYAAIGATCERGMPETYALGREYGWDMEAYLGRAIPDWNDIVADCAQFDAWEVPGTTYGSLVEGESVSLGEEEMTRQILDTNIGVAAVSQYNALLALQGKQGVELGENEYLPTNNTDLVDPLVDAVMGTAPELSILGNALSMKHELGDLQYEDSALLSGTLLFVVPDKVVDAMREAGAVPTNTVLNMNYRTPGNEGDASLHRALHDAFPDTSRKNVVVNGVDVTDQIFEPSDWPVWNTITRQEMVDQAKGFRLLISYLALYIGFVFLIATAAVLAIQQVSQTTDSEPRYRLLSKLGCDARMLGRSLLAQVLVYFLAPLAVAVCHASCAIAVMNDSLFAGLGLDLMHPIGASAVLVTVIYGGYMVVTYFVSRMMMRQAVKA